MKHHVSKRKQIKKAFARQLGVSPKDLQWFNGQLTMRLPCYNTQWVPVTGAPTIKKPSAADKLSYR